MITNSERLRGIFHAAVEDHAPGEWEAYLDRACGDDHELRQQAALLLKAHAEGRSWLSPAPSAPTIDGSAPGAPGTPSIEGAGTMIGP